MATAHPPLPSTMRAVVLHRFGGPLQVEERAVPTPEVGEILLRVRACAVDQFDLAIRDGRRANARVPLVLGHEIAGEVAALGPGVTAWRVGQRVASTLYITCGRCRTCRQGRETICENFGGYVGIETPGGYAEYTVLPADNLAALPDSIPFSAASLLANAAGTALHAFSKRMRLQPAERVVITGAGGGVGIHAVQIARAMGARVMAVDLGEDKAEAARSHGAEVAIDPTETDLLEAVRGWTSGVGADGVLELVGPATMPSALAALARGGRMVIVGSHTGSEFAFDPHHLYAKEWEILGSRNVSKDELRQVISLTAAGRLEPVVAGVHPLEDVEEAHEAVRARRVIGRLVLQP